MSNKNVLCVTIMLLLSITFFSSSFADTWGTLDLTAELREDGYTHSKVPTTGNEYIGDENDVIVWRTPNADTNWVGWWVFNISAEGIASGSTIVEATMEFYISQVTVGGGGICLTNCSNDSWGSGVWAGGQTDKYYYDVIHQTGGIDDSCVSADIQCFAPAVGWKNVTVTDEFDAEFDGDDELTIRASGTQLSGWNIRIDDKKKSGDSNARIHVHYDELPVMSACPNDATDED